MLQVAEENQAGGARLGKAVETNAAVGVKGMGKVVQTAGLTGGCDEAFRADRCTATARTVVTELTEDTGHS